MSENKSAPVAWRDVDLDGMCEAFSRCIEAQHHKDSPFHSPINADAMTALRILRGLLPAMKALAAPAPVLTPAQSLTEGALKTIAGWLADDMEEAVKNGANAVSMPDELVEIAAWIEATGQEGGKNHG